MKLRIVRHGETAANASRILQHPEEPLSERGLWQAAQLGERLRDAEIDLVISSDYQRARMTAEAVVAATGASLEIEPLLRERNFGAWRGRPYAELGFDPMAEDASPPGGETWAAFFDRAARAFDTVTARAVEAPGLVVVVTHGLVCRAFVQRHLVGEGPGFEGPWTNTSVTEVNGPPWTLHRVNCARHLEGGDASDDVAPA